MAQIDDDILNPLIRNNAFKAIEKLMESETSLACSSLLGIYTESLGTLYSIKVEKEGNLIRYEKPNGNYETFEKCLEYMGEEYIKINDEMKLHNHSIADIFRNGTTHEFEPKISYQIKINNSITTSLGVEYLSPIIIIINLLEYFRDLKNGFEKWRKELDSDHEKMSGVFYTSGYTFPPQGGIGIIESPEGEYVYKKRN